MTYYDEYIRKQAEQTFDQEKAKFALYDSDNNEMEEALDPQLTEEIFKGAMNEMVVYLYERRREIKSLVSFDSLFDSENVENISITARQLEAPIVIVEYEKTPEWFEMENVKLRTFCWYPNPYLSGKITAGFFQLR